jgi:hypothetical protein
MKDSSIARKKSYEFVAVVSRFFAAPAEVGYSAKTFS